jgi:hypothetical protein
MVQYIYVGIALHVWICTLKNALGYCRHTHANNGNAIGSDIYTICVAQLLPRGLGRHRVGLPTVWGNRFDILGYSVLL